MRLPLEPLVSEACDAGRPIVLSHPNSEAAVRLKAVAGRLALDLARLQWSDGAGGVHVAPQIRLDPTRGLVMRVLYGADEGREFVLPRGELAVCAPPTAERGGGPIVPTSVAPTTTNEGKPAVLVTWQGGNKTLLPCDELKRRALQHAKGCRANH